jgi:hypothetical protein
MLASVYWDGADEARRLETTILHSVSHDATDALIQGDEVQLLSALRLLQVQYPALSYARLDWRQGERVVAHRLGKPNPGSRVDEERVRVEVSYPQKSEAEIVVGLDQDILRNASRGVARKVLIGMLTVCALMSAIELRALSEGPSIGGGR